LLFRYTLCSPYTITDEIRRTETGMREKILCLQRIEYDEDQRVQILLGYYIMGKKPSSKAILLATIACARAHT
jgi:hypothetical protein